MDGVTIEDFEKDLKDNLYKIWNRMSSGTYFPPPVKAVEIPKPHGGGTSMLGVPTVADRVAQTVVARAGAEGRTDLPSRLLRLPAVPVGAGRGRGMPGALLEDRLGDRSGHPEVLRQRRSRPDGQGGGGPHRRPWVVLYVKRWLTAPLAAARRDAVSSGIEEPRRGPRSRRCWPTCSCTTRSTPGWPGSTRASGSSVTPTTWSCTA